MFQTTWIFFDILPRKVFFFRSELGWSATPGLIIETRNTTLFPFLDPCSNRVSINLIYLRDFFDPHPLCAEQNPVRPDPGSGYRIMFHDFCQSVTLVFCQRTHVSHDHHPRGPCCSRARISYDAPCMGAISYQKIFASALRHASVWAMGMRPRNLYSSRMPKVLNYLKATTTPARIGRGGARLRRGVRPWHVRRG